MKNAVGDNDDDEEERNREDKKHGRKLAVGVEMLGRKGAELKRRTRRG